MSRFFAAGSSDSDSSSSEEEFSDSEQSSQDESGSDSGSDSGDSDSDSDDSDAPKAKGNRFLAGADSDDSDDESDDGKKIVKSAKDKRLEEIESSVHIIENAQKINDWVTISSEFDKLNKLAEKAKAAHNLPKVYISTIYTLETESNDALKASKTKKLNPSNTRALNGLKQRIKKNNRTYESEIARYVANPDYEDEVPVSVAAATKTKDSAAPSSFQKAPSNAKAAADLEEDDGFATVGKGGKVLEYSPESIFKHLQAVFEARGKKNTNKEEQLNVLARLKEVAQTPYQTIRVLLATIAARFDFQVNLSQYMPVEAWKRAQAEVIELITLLENEREYTVLEEAPEQDDEAAQPVPSPETPVVQVRGSIVSYIDRLDDELTRALQNIDPHSQDYIDRLRDESALYTTIVRAQIYLETNGEKNIARLVTRRLEHLYYKSVQLIAATEANTYENLPANVNSQITPRNDDVPLIKRLAMYLYKNGSGLQRTRAMLCNIYSLALADYFHEARDMLLMSHLQDTIHNADIQTQILHNRTMVQLGLSAFRNGLVVEAQQALSEICGGNRAKELLAQGPSKNNRDAEQERLDKSRQLPFHLHLNIELSECVYLTSSMFMEIPEMARGSKRVISRQFRRTLDFSERQIFSGPPENTRDYIMQAAKALASGDWEKSYSSLAAIKILELMPNVDAIREMLKQKVRVEALRTYLFTYAPFYQSVALSQLTSLFDLTKVETMTIVSKMIALEEINASLSSDDLSVIFQRTETTRLQTQAMQLAEKAQRLVEANEQALDIKTPQNQRDGQRDGDNRPRRNQNYGGNRGGRRQDFQRLSQKIRA
ncbi:Eukaryotic translation initiation factor 3 subunit C [Taphrina deformans PYCC 5710]|uniref:Eukaryotic translation initiation factor 3 subunit C n=1 Tax=Taphrina deformans (strain PYCC 5710 / ATCC 11124 / CBS 356.35 / IMI 108563 / JCM 9778 / NBRC 8474) TaxID=1097556 RepID=R4XC03_TAPDE|nr:Eukaryotic translation initiation factor 3 subunit C [Taphrina deformans PYCC 5710]|eukprot:CCG83090.1 Eukaryotic translation initiation factor 3 subunit C [Taphrina deformans PYCC 5710]